MTSGQKIAVSILLTIILFTTFTVVAFSGLFTVLETKFYQPAVVNGIDKRLEKIASSFTEYEELYTQRFKGFSNLGVVKRSLLPAQSGEDITERTEKTGELLSSNSGILGIRIIDSNGKRIHFSTFTGDILKSKSSAVAYNNYDKLNEIPFQYLSVPDEANGSLYFDIAGSRLVFCLPFNDSYEAYRGTICFYVASSDFNRFLVNRHLITVTETCILTGPDQENEGRAGYVFGLPQVGSEIIQKEIVTKWQNGIGGTEKLLETDNGVWIILSHPLEISISSNKNEVFYIAQLEKEEIFLFPDIVKILLLICVFVTIFLFFFLVFSLRHDDMVVIRDRIKRFQFALISEYLDHQEEADWDKISREVKARKNDVSQEVKRSLGRRGKRHNAEVDRLLDKSWNDILSALGKPPTNVRTIASNASRGLTDEDTKEIRGMLEQILSSGAVVQKSVTESSVEKVKPKTKVKTTTTPKVAPIDEVSSVEAVEELEEIEEAEPIGEVSPVEEAAPVEEVEELEEIEEVAPVEEIEPAETVEELEEVAPAEGIEPVEELEEIEEAEPIGEVSPVEEVAPVEEVEELEEIEEVAPVEEIEPAETVEELEEVAPAEEIEPVEELEEIEEIEEAEPIDEVAPVEEVEEVAPVEEIDEVAPIEEIEEAEPIDEVSPVDEATPVEAVGELEEIDEVAPIEEIEEAEPIDEVAPVEEVEEIPLTDFMNGFIEDSDSIKHVTELSEKLEIGDKTKIIETPSSDDLADQSEVLNNFNVEKFDFSFLDNVSTTDDSIQENNLQNSKSIDIESGVKANTSVAAEETIKEESVIESVPSNSFLVKPLTVLSAATVESVESIEPVEPVEISSQVEMKSDNGINTSSVKEPEAELLPIDDDLPFFTFTPSEFKGRTKIQNLEPVGTNPIQENNGVFMISDTLDTSGVEQNKNFKKLVDSVLR